MEVAPEHLNLDVLCQRLENIPDVTSVHDIHSWTITDGYYMLIAHVTANFDNQASHNRILRALQDVAYRDFGITHLTVQWKTPLSVAPKTITQNIPTHWRLKPAPAKGSPVLSRLKLVSLLVPLWVIVLLLSVEADAAFAQSAEQQEDITGPIRIDRKILAGGYDLFVEAEASSLSLGTALVSVAVLNAVTGEPVPDARVVIHTRHIGSSETGWASALGVPERPEIYRRA